MELAKQAVLKYAPEYYEINQPPLITKFTGNIGGQQEDVERVTYTLKYLYKKEFYDKYPDAYGISYLGSVYIWEDTGLVYSVGFEGLGFHNLDKRKKQKGLKKRIVF